MSGVGSATTMTPRGRPVLTALMAGALALLAVGTAARADDQAELVRKLRTAPFEERERAARAIGRLARPSAATVRALAESLTDGLVQHDAARALAALGPRAAGARDAAVDALRAGAGKPVITGELVTFLGRLGPDHADAVWAAVRDVADDEELSRFDRRDACIALGELGPGARGAVPSLLAIARDAEDEDLRAAALIGLGGIGPDAAEAEPLLREAFAAAEGQRARIRLAEALHRTTGDAEPALAILRKLLKLRPDRPIVGGTITTYAMALQLAGSLETDGGELVAILVADSWKWGAAEHADGILGALGRIGDARAAVLDRCEEGLASDRERTRVAAVIALARLTPSDAADRSRVARTLAGAVDDDARAVRRAAVDALGALDLATFPAAPTVAALAKVLGSDRHGERLRALAALAGLEGAPADAVTRAIVDNAALGDDAFVTGEARKVIAARGSAAGPVLIDALGSDRDAVRALAADALLALERDAPAVLVTGLDDARPAVQRQAAALLGRLGPEAASAVGALAEALVAAAPAVRQAAADALARVGPAAEPAVARLENAAATDETAKVATAAARALGALGEVARPATPTLLAILARDAADMATRSAAAEAIGRIGRPADAATIAALLAASETQGAAFAPAATLALGRVSGKRDGKAIASLRKTLRGEDAALRAAAAEALGAVDRPPSAVKRDLEQAAANDDDAAVRKAAAAALRAID